MTTYVGEWLTLPQACDALGVTRAGLRELWEAGEVEVTQIRPGSWRVKNDDVQALLTNRTAGGAP